MFVFIVIKNKKYLFVYILVIEAEKGQQQLIAGIENFDPAKLKPTVTEEKNPLPTKEGIVGDDGHNRHSLSEC